VKLLTIRLTHNQAIENIIGILRLAENQSTG
jgi:hypothetical protein